MDPPLKTERIPNCERIGEREREREKERKCLGESVETRREVSHAKGLGMSRRQKHSCCLGG